jgi:hypothetical protein
MQGREWVQAELDFTDVDALLDEWFKQRGLSR